MIHRPPVLTKIRQYIDNLIEYLTSSASPARVLPIVTMEMPVTSSSCILYNTEQLTRQEKLHYLLLRARQRDISEVWDYSTANIQILADNGITARHCPVGVAPAHIQRIHRFQAKGCCYDVGFCGKISQRRLQIIQELKAAGLTVCIIMNKIGDARDALLARCRVIINIHYAEDYQVFESVRCAPWLEVGKPVVSEQCLDNDPRAINVPYAELVSATLLAVEKARNLVHVLHEGAKGLEHTHQ